MNKYRTSRVLMEVAMERERQDAKFGETNDDLMDPAYWHNVIADYNAWARRMAQQDATLQKARRRYVQIAALAVAAVEAIDRKNA